MAQIPSAANQFANAVANSTPESPAANPSPTTPAPNGAAEPSPARKPSRAPVPVSKSDIPPAQRGGDWLEDVAFLKAHPGEYFVFECVGASTVTYLRKTFGLDAKGRHTRTVDEAGNKVPAGQPGRKVVDIYVGYVPEMVEDIKAGRVGRRARQA